jgi:hypothetical protein
MRKLLLPSLLLAAIALPAQASAAGGDVATTASYLRANYALVSIAHTKQRPAEAALASLLAHVRSECPRLVVGSPQNEASEKLTAELIASMHLVALKTLAGAIGSYVQSVSKLQWSNQALTRAVHTYARELLAQSRLAVPDICAELSAWKSSGYTALPAATLPFNKAFYAVFVGVGELPQKQLAPFISGSQRGMIARTLKLEQDVVEFEAAAVETWGKIMDAVGLNP